MFDKKDDNTNSTTDVFRPAKGSAKVVIGHGVTINGEIKKADEVQIDGEADVTMKTDNVVIGSLLKKTQNHQKKIIHYKKQLKKISNYIC